MAITGSVNQIISTRFTVTDSNGNLVDNLSDIDFNVHLYNPGKQEVSSIVPVTITSMSYGHYAVEFTPISEGLWYIIVYHNDYFPWGKAECLQVFNKTLNEMPSTIDVGDVVWDEPLSEHTIPGSTGEALGRIDDSIQNFITQGCLTNEQAIALIEIYRILGLDPTRPLIVTDNSVQAGPEIFQTIDYDESESTVTRTT